MSSAEPEFTGRRRRRIILAASAGNFAEWYDWGVYGVVATIIATQFFPPGDAVVGLLSTYAVFRARLSGAAVRRDRVRPHRRQVRA